MFAYTNNYSVEHLLKLLRASYTITPRLTSFLKKSGAYLGDRHLIKVWSNVSVYAGTKVQIFTKPPSIKGKLF